MHLRDHLLPPRGQFIGFGGKVHGVATLIRTDIVHRIKTRRPEWDLEARTLEHDIGEGLVVINGYWVNGTDHRYRDPITGEFDGRTRHDFKLHYHQLILSLVLQVEKEGKAVLLAGNMNIVPARINGFPNLRVSPIQHAHSRKGFNDNFGGPEAMNGADVFRHLHSQERKHTWHSTNAPHGTVCDRFDLIIASRKLIIEGSSSIVDSDNCPLWVIVDLVRVSQILQGKRPISARAEGSTVVTLDC